jgi:hypothetical protein
LAQKTGIPLVTTVWDPPDGISKLSGMDSLSIATACRDHERAIRSSARCSVISERMQSEYQSKFNVPCTILRHAPKFPTALVRKTNRELEDREVFRIGFCGSLYASTEWTALIAALDSIGWSVDSQSITLRVIGAALKVKTTSRAHVEYFGYRSPLETRHLLSQCNVGYVPYWFDPRFSSSVRLCFPTKLTAYLASGLPVFFHGPRDSSPTDFLERFPAGVSCHSLSADTIASAIEGLARNRASAHAMQDAGQLALKEELNEDIFLERFAKFIGCSLNATPHLQAENLN